MPRQKKSIRPLIIVLCVIALIVIVVSRSYYSAENSSQDPRIVPAREMYEKYNHFADNQQYDSIFKLMDAIEGIYASLDHYKDSYETGVLYNNRAAAWLTRVISDQSTDSLIRDSLLNLANHALRSGIRIYETWQDQYNNKEADEIRNGIRDDFMTGLESYTPEERERFLQTRVSEISEAQTEIDRRLSVTYTNLGIVYRHRQQYDSAMGCYEKALDLWDRNLTAENNMNSLLGLPQKKRNFIERMFPPERIRD